MERKLAAILAADVVGYSALMERDEAGTFDRLKAGRKELFEPEIARRHGRIFKLMGDGLLAEFGSVVDAVECAVGLQRGLAERNADVPEDERIEVRIGVNLGEVIVDGRRPLRRRRERRGAAGAARRARRHLRVRPRSRSEVEKKLAFGFESMGEQQVKNIAEPVHAYRVVLDGSARRPPARPLALPDQASIAVLPFTNMSGDPGAGLFRRRAGRGPDHQSVENPRPVRHRAQLDLRLQGQGGGHPPGRQGARRPLRAGGQRPQGRRTACASPASSSRAPTQPMSGPTSSRAPLEDIFDLQDRLTREHRRRDRAVDHGAPRSSGRAASGPTGSMPTISICARCRTPMRTRRPTTTRRSRFSTKALALDPRYTAAHGLCRLEPRAALPARRLPARGPRSGAGACRHSRSATGVDDPQALSHRRLRAGQHHA